MSPDAIAAEAELLPKSSEQALLVSAVICKHIGQIYRLLFHNVNTDACFQFYLILIVSHAL